MATHAIERQRSVVELLEIAHHDHLLEIGCGHGDAVGLICERLRSGTITAIDRSDKMRAVAQKKNKGCIEAGKAEFHHLALDKATFAGKRFNKVFALNVNAFWIEAKAELENLPALLTPQGRIYLFYQPPRATQIAEITRKVRAMLEQHGFIVERDSVTEGDKFHTLCIVARVA